jgi:hypothetical protein
MVPSFLADAPVLALKAAVYGFVIARAARQRRLT